MSEGRDESHVLLRTDDAAELTRQVLELWVNPEIQRRRAAGIIDETFGLAAAQIVFLPAGGVTVRFNDEMNGHITADGSFEVEEGEPVPMSAIEDIVGFDLVDDDVDSAHLTLIYRGDGTEHRWLLISDLRFNRGSAQALADAAREFLDAARDAHERDQTRARARSTARRRSTADPDPPGRDTSPAASSASSSCCV